MIKIKWKEIKYDVDQQTWRLARMRITDLENKEEAQTDKRETSELLILRFAESGNAMVGVALREKLMNSTVSVSTDELNIDMSEWSYTFKSATEAKERDLAMLIHKFVVLYCLYRWAFLYLPDEANMFNKEMVSALEQITSSAYNMNTPIKKHRPIVRETVNEIEEDGN